MRRAAALFVWTIACGGQPSLVTVPVLPLGFDGAGPARPLGSWQLAPWSADADWTAGLAAARNRYKWGPGGRRTVSRPPDHAGRGAQGLGSTKFARRS
jgi:hypothetical protein